jgi:hypothetical protein
VSPSSEWAHRLGSSSEETSSDEEEEESPSSSLSSPNAHRFFDVAVESSASSSLAYLRLFSEEAIGVTEWNFLGYKCHHSGLYGVTMDLSNDVYMVVHETLELPVMMVNDYVSLACRCCGPQ